MQTVKSIGVRALGTALATLTATLLTALAVPARTDAADLLTAVDSPPTTTRNAYYAHSRPPLRTTPLVELPVGAVRPAGWLRKQLELQAAGFHGHLGEISRFLNKDRNAWLDPVGAGAHGWEEVPYWLKGYILTAYLLNDPAQIREAHTWIEGALRSQQPDGWFGPQQTRSTVSSTQGKYDLWPNMVMLFCLQSYYDHTADTRVLDLMTKYFQWELRVPDEDFLPPFWQQQRAADNLYSVYWLYNRTGDQWLLDLATKIHDHTANWTDDVANWHNVNMAQAFGGPTTYFLQSGDVRHRQASYRNDTKIRSLYGQVPGGMFAGDENCRAGFHDPHQAIETCGMIEMMLSCETLVGITGDLFWADRCEDVAFNSLPAALTADFRALRYLTAPNMVVSDRANHSPGVQNTGAMFHMNPHAHRCCQHNYGHGWPYYAVHLWSATADNGLAAVFYSASDVTARVGDGTEVTIRQATHYPFDEKIQLTVDTPKSVRFPLYLRVPGWCLAAELAVNGNVLQHSAGPRQFICIERQWNQGDTIELTLPMQIALRTWQQNGDSVSVDRGPLTYSLKIGEKYVRAGGTDKWPAWEIHPTTPWNFGLVVDKSAPANSFQVIRRDWPANDMPLTLADAPIELRGRGRRIPEWQIDQHGLVAKVPPSPVKSTEPVETITLVPMGAARLRISSFPVITNAPADRAATLRFVLITCSVEGKFFEPVKQGMQDAARMMQVECTFTGTEGVDLPKQAAMVRKAVADGCDGIALNLVDPEAFDEVVEEAIRQGVPVVAFNVDDHATPNARLSTVNQQFYEAGRTLAEHVAPEIPENAHLLLTQHDRGISALDDRLRGLQDVLRAKHGKWTVVVTGNDANQGADVVAKALREHADIRIVLGTGQSDTEAAGRAIEAHFRDRGYWSAGFDLSPETLRLIEAGQIRCTVDQQPYMQGFYPVVQLALYVRYGILPSDIDAGATIIDRSNVRRVKELTKKNYR